MIPFSLKHSMSVKRDWRCRYRLVLSLPYGCDRRGLTGMSRAFGKGQKFFQLIMKQEKIPSSGQASVGILIPIDKSSQFVAYVQQVEKEESTQIATVGHTGKSSRICMYGAGKGMPDCPVGEAGNEQLLHFGLYIPIVKLPPGPYAGCSEKVLFRE